MTNAEPANGKAALITGITGQDGSYLAELLLAKGYEVHGLVRRGAASTQRIDHLLADPDADDTRLFLHQGDLTDATRMVALLSRIAPDEVYHLGAQSAVRASFDEPGLTGDVTGLGTLRLLEAIRMCEIDTRFYQASSADMFGATPPPQDERTPVAPRSPHGAAKAYAYWTTRGHREAFDLFAVNGIAFNHESPRRGAAFVTRKIARAAAHIAVGREEHVVLGDLTAVRDWGYAPEYVEGMWAMLQQDVPRDYVLATGTAHSVEDFARMCFAHVGLDWSRHVRVDERHRRPVEVDALIGDPGRAGRELGWRPRTFAAEIARIMVDAELASLSAPAASLRRGAGSPLAG